jgi:hypothetical protein
MLDERRVSLDGTGEDDGEETAGERWEDVAEQPSSASR